jgi:hypothetical protein
VRSADLIAGGPPRAPARFPTVPESRGHYESFYLKAAHPEAPLAVWIRYTVHKRPNAAPRSSLWFTLFDDAGDGPLASKVTLDGSELGAGHGDYIRIGDARFSPERVAGRARSDQLHAEWDLALAGDEEPLRHLPRDWMYRAPVPRTKLESPHPAARFSGRIVVGERKVDLDGWPGMVGHNWGTEHAERWIWLHGARFAEDPTAWLDVAIGRVRVGPLTTPWIANGVLSLRGRRHRLGGIERIRGTRVEEGVGRCELTLPGADLTVRGSVACEVRNLVGWLYADPDGSEHNVLNCSIASMRLQADPADGATVELATPSGAAYELGMSESDHGVPVQPFADG